MDYQHAEMQNGNVVLQDVRHFDLDEILDCGQCFRWQRTGEKQYTGTAWRRTVTVAQEENKVIFYNTGLQEFEQIWHPYFDFDRDYGEIKKRLEENAVMKKAVSFCQGMRVVRQEPWEALVSFIISQNNNILRIKGIVERLCSSFGEPLPEGGNAFPTAGRLAQETVEGLAPIRSGFRAKYILDAATLVASGQLELTPLYQMDIEQARQQLMQIKGVGVKVAECALLYGLSRIECFPVDVWIKRALEQLYPDGFPQEFSDIAGLGQQYLFHYMRKSVDTGKQTKTEKEAAHV